MKTLTSTDQVLAAFRSVVEPECLSTNPAERLAHGRDSWPALAKWTDEQLTAIAPLAVISPRTVAEVSAVLAAASAHGIPVVPYGSGSGVVGGVVPEGPAISLDMRSLQGIIDFSLEDMMVTAYAGTQAVDLERHLNEQGCTLGHYPQSLPLASVGGLVATRSSGTFSSKYGNIEDLVLALEVVLPDGRVVANRPVPRSSTGPRLSDLFIGSEGTLGVIVKVSLKVMPLPEVRCFRGIAFPRWQDGLEAVHAFFQYGAVPAVIRLYNPAEAEHLVERAGLQSEGKSLLIIGFDGPRRVVEAEESLVLELCAERQGEDLGRPIGEEWERGRFDAFWLERGNAGDRKVADAIEVAGAWSVLPTLLERVSRAVLPMADSLWAHFSHFYPQGGSIYFIFFASGDDREAALAKYHAIWKTVLEEVIGAGGSISHHHGIGQMRAPWLATELGTSLDLLKMIKNALDPAGILNPGKLGLPGK